LTYKNVLPHLAGVLRHIIRYYKKIRYTRHDLLMQTIV